MIHFLLSAGLWVGGEYTPRLHSLQDGTPVLWLPREGSERTTMIWSLARGNASVENAEVLDLWVDGLALGSATHPGSRWRWMVADLGAEIQWGISPFRLWFWVDVPAGQEAQAVDALTDLLDGWRPPMGHVRRQLRAQKRDVSYRGIESVSEQLRQRWLGVGGCPVAPPLDWSDVSWMGQRRALIATHRGILNDGVPSLTIRGPHGPEDLAESLAPLMWRGGLAVRLECSQESEAEAYDGQVIVVDYPSSRVEIRAIQPLGMETDVRQAEVIWSWLNTDSGDLAYALRGKSGLSYGHRHSVHSLPGLNVVELSLQVDAGEAGEVLQNVERAMEHQVEKSIQQAEWQIGFLQEQRKEMMRTFDAPSEMSWWSWNLHLGRVGEGENPLIGAIMWDVNQAERTLEELTSMERRTWLLVGDVSVIGPALLAEGIEIDAVWDSENW